jgi:hypothetical protein
VPAAPRNDADVLGFAQRHAVQQIGEVLHADESGPAVLLGDAERAGELPGVHRRRADVARLAGFDDVV